MHEHHYREQSDGMGYTETTRHKQNKRFKKSLKVKMKLVYVPKIRIERTIVMEWVEQQQHGNKISI